MIEQPYASHVVKGDLMAGGGGPSVSVVANKTTVVTDKGPAQPGSQADLRGKVSGPGGVIDNPNAAQQAAGIKTVAQAQASRSFVNEYKKGITSQGDKGAVQAIATANRSQPSPAAAPAPGPAASPAQGQSQVQQYQLAVGRDFFQKAIMPTAPAPIYLPVDRQVQDYVNAEALKHFNPKQMPGKSGDVLGTGLVSGYENVVRGAGQKLIDVGNKLPVTPLNPVGYFGKTATIAIGQELKQNPYAPIEYAATGAAFGVLGPIAEAGVGLVGEIPVIGPFVVRAAPLVEKAGAAALIGWYGGGKAAQYIQSPTQEGKQAVVGSLFVETGAFVGGAMIGRALGESVAQAPSAFRGMREAQRAAQEFNQKYAGQIVTRDMFLPTTSDRSIGVNLRGYPIENIQGYKAFRGSDFQAAVGKMSVNYGLPETIPPESLDVNAVRIGGTRTDMLDLFRQSRSTAVEPAGNVFLPDVLAKLPTSPKAEPGVGFKTSTVSELMSLSDFNAQLQEGFSITGDKGFLAAETRQGRAPNPTVITRAELTSPNPRPGERGLSLFELSVSGTKLPEPNLGRDIMVREAGTGINRNPRLSFSNEIEYRPALGYTPKLGFFGPTGAAIDIPPSPPAPEPKVFVFDRATVTRRAAPPSSGPASTGGGMIAIMVPPKVIRVPPMVVPDLQNPLKTRPVGPFEEYKPVSPKNDLFPGITSPKPGFGNREQGKNRESGAFAAGFEWRRKQKSDFDQLFGKTSGSRQVQIQLPTGGQQLTPGTDTGQQSGQTQDTGNLPVIAFTFGHPPVGTGAPDIPKPDLPFPFGGGNPPVPSIVDDRLFPKTKLKKEKNLFGFNVFVRRRGKFRQINRYALPYQTALSEGARAVDKSIAATFKLRPAETPVPPAFEGAVDTYFQSRQGRYYPKNVSGETVYIQYARFRLSSAGEKAEINAARGPRRKKGRRGLFDFVFL